MNKLKDGEDYEKFVFNIIKDKYISCFLWKDIPTKILDIKYYKNNKRVKKMSKSSFHYIYNLEKKFILNHNMDYH